MASTTQFRQKTSLPDRANARSANFNRNLSPTLLEFVAVFVTLLVYGFGESAEAFNFSNLAGPILLSLALGWGCWRIISSGSAGLWAPLLWYRVAFLTYFGIGALVPSFVNSQTRSLMDQFFLAYGRDVLKVNLLLAVFHLIVISISSLVFFILDTRNNRKEKGEKTSIVPSNIGIFPLGMICLGAGTMINYFVIVPGIFNLYELSSLSSLANFSSISLVGYFMLTSWAVEHKSKTTLYFVLAVAAGETMIGVLAMTKLVALLPGVMIAMGFIFRKPSLFRLATFGGIIITVFMFIAPIITFARETNQKYYGGDPTASDIIDIYKSYFGTNRRMASADSDEFQTGWMRLSYTNAGAFAVNQYDRGLPGDSYKYLPIVLIPRLIYPKKPAITDVSREFSFAANGNYDSSSSPGIPSEAYWDFGWAGVFVVAAAIGAVLALWSAYSLLVIDRGAWHLFFVVLLGMRISTRIDGALVGDFVGPLGVAVLSHLALQLINRFLPQVMAALRRHKPALR